MKKILLAIGLIMAICNQNAQAQLLKKLKEKVTGTSTTSSQKNEEASNNKTNQSAAKSTLTDFQRSKLKELVFLNKTELDPEWNGESESDCIKEIELGQPLSFKMYFDNGGWNYDKEDATGRYLDIRFICEGETYTGYDLTKYAYEKVEKAPGQNTFGHMVKFETASTLESVLFQKTKEWVTFTLQAPRGLYWPQITRAEDAFRMFLATKLKSKLQYGKTLKMRIEIYKTDQIGYSPSKTPKVGEVYASGEINLKITPYLKQLNTPHYRFFAEGFVDKAMSEASAKQIEAKFPTTVKKVYKVTFLDNDFIINRNINGQIVSRSITGWALFETHDGICFNTKTTFTYPYNGSTYSNTPSLMDSGKEDATFPVLSNHANFK